MKTISPLLRVTIISILALIFFWPDFTGNRTVRAATCTVTTDADSGPGSLREKIADTSCTLINFAGDYTITLASELTISQSVTIDGTGHNVTLDGNHSVRVFKVNSDVTFHLMRLTVANGKISGDVGGGIYNFGGTLTVTNCAFNNNQALFGGGIHSSWGTLTVANSTFSSNSATLSGGGIYHWNLDSGSSVTDSTFTANTASENGGGINTGGSLNVIRVTFSNNGATNGGGIYNSDTHDLYVTESNFSDNSATNGGGIYNGGDLNVSGSTFTSNHATSGGAIHSFQDSWGFVTDVTGSTLTGNAATSDGGGIFNIGTTLDVTSTSFTNNQAVLGGAIYTLQSSFGVTTKVTSSTFSDNRATSGGGGVFNHGATLDVTFTTFTSNDGHSYGGGIYNYTGVATVINSSFYRNVAYDFDIGFEGRGGAIHNSSTLHVTDCTFFDNDSSYGAGISSSNGTLYVTNSTFSSNFGVMHGGGLSNETGTATVANSTFSGNGSNNNSGGLYNNSGTLMVNNSLVANSILGRNCAGTISGVNNLSDDDFCGASFTNSSPILLGALGNYGGSTQTFPLLPGSTAINATSANCPATDQRGSPRPLPCDIGAFESQGFTLDTPSGTPQSTLIHTPFATLLGLTVAANNPVEPVNGGRVTFIAPASGPSAVITSNPATITTGSIGVSATANGTEGTYNISASATGVSAAGTFNLTNLAATTTALSSSANPSQGQSVIFTATIVPAPTGGTVTFKKNGANLSGCVDVSVSAGQATCTVSTLVYGGQVITAFYNGFDYYLSSVSTNLTQWAYPRPALSAGGSDSGGHSCRLQTDGTLACWGDNSSGQANIPSNPNWMQVSLGALHSCGLKTDSTLACWGSNFYGALDIPTPNTAWAQVSAGGGHTCGLKTDGTLLCWGYNGNGQTTIPEPNANWMQVSAGNIFTCGLKTDGTLACWGYNGSGQTTIPTPNADWTHVSAGRNHACGLKADGTLTCWGNADQTTVPAPNADWAQVSAGAFHTCGIKTDGTLLCWGMNLEGQLNVPSNPNWSQVSAGSYHTCGVKTDGTPFCWGWNGTGQAPVITLNPTALSPATYRLAYATSLTGAGGTTPYLLTLYAGSLPPGLTLNADGSWSGVPTVPGTFNFTAQARDANAFVGTRDYTLTVNKADTTTLFTADTNDPSLVGVPALLNFQVGSGVSGTPTGEVTVSDGAGATCTGALVAGNGSCALTFTTPGLKTLTATYAGDDNFNGSVSSGEPHTVNAENTYADPTGVCAGNLPCYTSLQAAINAAASGHTVTVYGGTYNEALNLAQNVTVVLAGDVALGGSFTQAVGATTAGSHALTIGGDFSQTGGNFTASTGVLTFSGDFARTGGTFDPNGGSVWLDGLRTQTLQAAEVNLHHLTVDDHLRGYWNLDEGNGTSTADASGNGQNGMFSGIPTWETTALPPLTFSNPASLSFNGTNAFVSGPATALPGGSRALTVLAWIKTTTTTRGTAFSYGTASANQTVSLNVNQLAANGHFVVDFYGNYTDAGVVVNDGTWHLVGFTLAEGSTTLQMYVDGVAYPRTLAAVPDIPSGTTFQIGRWVATGAGDTTPYYFNGAVDDVRVYDRVLTAEEVATLYAGEERRGQVTLQGDLTLTGDYTQAGGSFSGGAGDLTVNGNFALTGGLFTTPGGVLDVAGTSAHPGGTILYTPTGMIRETQPVPAGRAPTLYFPLTDVTIDVSVPGTLATFVIERHEQDHPAATRMNGRYWTITPIGSGTVNLTLPFSELDYDPALAQVCRYTDGAGDGWECTRTSSTATTVTRNGVSEFSDWAVGDRVGPTAVTLHRLTAHGTTSAAVVWVVTLLGALMLALAARTRRNGMFRRTSA